MNEWTPEQQLAITELDVAVVVRAGAGAGKTKVLVERYVNILQEKRADVEGIVAITFTRKAAQEMKERIRLRVREIEAAATESTEAKRWKETGRRLAAAPISTIHSLCTRILKENPVEAGLDPEFSLMEDVDDQVLRDQTWQETIAELLKKRNPAVERLASFYTRAQLESDFLTLCETLEQEGVLGNPSVTDISRILSTAASEGTKCIEMIQTAAQELFALAPRTGKMNATEEKVALLRENWSAVECSLALSKNGDLTGLETADSMVSALQARGKMAAEIRGLKDCLRRLKEQLLDGKAREVWPDLYAVLQKGSVAYQEAKQRQRVLTFDDLEHRTALLLASCPEVCRTYGSKIQFLMVDECQDINERQRRIIYLLAGGNADILRGRNLFAVGDPKQSIYRFRGADVRVFERLTADVKAGGGTLIDLYENFRSDKTLVSAYNDLFQRLMPAVLETAGADGSDVLAYTSLQGVHGRPETTSLHFLVLERDPQNEVANNRDSEAAVIAAKIVKSVQTGSWLVRDDNQQARPAKFGDIALLLRAFSDVRTYEYAFQSAGIPYYTAGGKGFFGCQEVRDVVSLLRFIENPYNEGALFGLLRSSFFLIPDARFVGWKRLGGTEGLWNGLRQDADADAATVTGLLQKLLENKRNGTVADIVARALEVTGYGLVQLAQFMGERKYANVMKLLRMAEEFPADGGGIASFLERGGLLASSEAEAELDSETGDTVRILTIHKSKGLEFPVVVIPDLQRKFNTRKPLAVYDREMGLGLKVPGTGGRLEESGGYRRTATRDAALEKGELKRLLYVAMTRARDHLVLSAVSDAGTNDGTLTSSSGWAGWCKHFFGLSGPVSDWPSSVPLGDASMLVELVSAPTDAEDLGRNETVPTVATGSPVDKEAPKQTGKLPETLRPSIIVSPSRLKDFITCPRRYFYADMCRIPGIGEKASACDSPAANTYKETEIPAALLGTAFHRALEISQVAEDASGGDYETDVPLQWREAIRTQTEEWLQLYRQSALCKDTAGLPSDKEWAFQLLVHARDNELGAVRLSGQVDRIVHHPDGSVTIVDYKTDRVTANFAQEKTARYHLQLACYMKAAQAVYQKPVKEVRVYYARLGQDVTVEASALAATWREIEETADFLRRHEQEEDYVCCREYCEGCPFRHFCPQD